VQLRQPDAQQIVLAQLWQIDDFDLMLGEDLRVFGKAKIRKSGGYNSHRQNQGACAAGLKRCHCARAKATFVFHFWQLRDFA